MRNIIKLADWSALDFECDRPDKLYFVRVTNLPKNRKKIHLGPCPGGRFWALSNAHDLPYDGSRWIFVSAKWMLAHRKVYIHNAEKNDSWRELSSIDELRQFRSSLVDGDYDSCAVYQKVDPYLPEFYVMKKRKATW